MFRVELENIKLSGRAINKFGTLPSIQLGGAIIYAISELGSTIPNLRVSRLLGITGEGEILIPIENVFNYLLMKFPSISEDKKMEEYLDEKKKKIKKLKLTPNELNLLVKALVDKDREEISKIIDKEMRESDGEKETFEGKTKPLPKKTRYSTGLYNMLMFEQEKGVFLVDGVEKSLLREALEFLEDLGISADKTTFSSFELKDISSFNLPDGSLNIFLSDVIAKEEDLGKVFGKPNVYSYAPFNESVPHSHKFYFVEAFSVSESKDVGLDLVCNGCKKVFPGKPISLGVGENV